MCIRDSDNVTNKEVKASLGISFTTTTATTANDYKDRYTVVFKPASALSVKLVSVKAQQQNKDINVSWTTANEINIASYQVEKSENGETYTVVNNQAAKNVAEAGYNWLDVKAVKGINYYRIKVVEKEGQVSYSKVVAVNIGTGKGQVAVYPNPISGNMFNLQMNNIVKGTYTVRLINSLGQEVLTTKISHEEGSSSETITTKMLASGIYSLLLAGEDGVLCNTELIVK